MVTRVRKLGRSNPFSKTDVPVASEGGAGRTGDLTRDGGRATQRSQ
jgi:hypothetical protein